MWRTMKMAAFALAATMAMSGIALAQYDRGRDDDGYYRHDSGQAQQYGYQNGYNNGVGKGRHEGRERDRHDYQTPDWGKATHGYKGWMGSKDVYADAYRDGYRAGFRSGYDEVAGGFHGGRGSYGWQNEGGRNGYGADGGNVANRFGYQDGAEAAREDVYHRKEYNSKPRGRFGDRDHGYERDFGSKDRYKDEYTAGYRAGYDSVMRRY